MGCIRHLSTVDLEVAARDNEVVVFVFWRLEQFEDVASGERVDSVLRVLRLAMELSAHRVGLAWWVGNNKLPRATRVIKSSNNINMTKQPSYQIQSVHKQSRWPSRPQR